MTFEKQNGPGEPTIRVPEATNADARAKLFIAAMLDHDLDPREVLTTMLGGGVMMAQELYGAEGAATLLRGMAESIGGQRFHA